MRLTDYKGALDKEECETARLLYICNIIKQFDEIKWLLPTAAQEKSYDEALAHMVRVLSGNNNTPSSFGGNILRSCGEGCSKEKNRKYCLKEILDLLLSMQRNRLYDPPSDQEIGYYLLIKKYIKSIIIFYETRYGAARDAELRCLSPFRYLDHMMQLVELNKYFEDLLPFVLNMDIKNGLKIKPIMDIEHMNELPAIIHGSKERSNMYYWHKFQIALQEVRSSKFPLIPPSSEEKKAYLQALGLMAPPSFSSKEDGVNVYTKELHHLFIETIVREVSKVGRQCRKIEELVFKKLSLDKEWGTLLQQYSEDDREALSDVSREMAKNCDVSREELPSFIACLDQCQQILANLTLLIIGVHTDNRYLIQSVGHCIDDYREDDEGELGWEAFHVLAVLKHAACESRPKMIGVGRIRSTVRSTSKINRTLHKRPNLSKLDPSESVGSLNHDCTWMRNCIAVGKEKETGKEKEKEKNENVNVKVLERIIEDLKVIGDSDVRPDEEELKLMHKIWNNVASSVHFFFCATVYEKKRNIIECGGLSDVGMFGAKTSKVLDGVDVREAVYKVEELNRELLISSDILYAYKGGLVQKFEKLQKPSKFRKLEASHGY